MKKSFIGVLFFLMLISCGCGVDPDSILQAGSYASGEDTGEGEILSENGENEEAQEDEPDGSGSETEDDDRIFAYICGAVNAPGVYELSADSRIFELVEKAGGLTEDADGQSVNLAGTVEDGQMVYIMTVEESEAGGTAGASTLQADTEAGITSDGKVNINKASAEELTTLSGIGETKAASIIAYRESHGSFQSIEEIMQVDGIAQGTYDKIKDSITVQNE